VIKFIRREFVRQAPIGFALVGLGILLTVAALVFAANGYMAQSAAAGTIVIMIVAAPLLFGVASVAPDTETGALAFLARVPLPARTQLLVRWGVAAGLAVATVLASWILERLLVREAGDPLETTGPVVWLLALCAFAAGVASSVAFRRTLTALLLAPVIFGAPALAIAALVHALGEGQLRALEAGAGASVAPFLLVGAAVAFLRSDLHRATLRPLKIVASAAVMGALVGSGGVYAWDVAGSDWRLSAWPALRDVANKRVLFVQWHRGGLGEIGEQRFVFVPLDGSAARLALPSYEEAPIAVSPDGAKILGIAKEELRLIDIATGRVESGPIPRTPFGARRLFVEEPRASSWRGGVAWRDGQPLLSSCAMRSSSRGAARRPGSPAASRAPAARSRSRSTLSTRARSTT
jgi:hypothetical protein